MNVGKFLFTLAKTKVGDYVAGVTFKYCSKLLPVKKVFEDKYVIAFWHPKPFWDKHIVIVPKKKIKNITSLKPTDSIYITKVFECVQKIVLDYNWIKYSVIVNGGKRQEVNQLHFHLSSGSVTD